MQADAPCQRHSSSSVTASAAHSTWGGGRRGGQHRVGPALPHGGRWLRIGQTHRASAGAGSTAGGAARRPAAHPTPAIGILAGRVLADAVPGEAPRCLSCSWQTAPPPVSRQGQERMRSPAHGWAGQGRARGDTALPAAAAGLCRGLSCAPHGSATDVRSEPGPTAEGRFDRRKERRRETSSAQRCTMGGRPRARSRAARERREGGERCGAEARRCHFRPASRDGRHPARRRRSGPGRRFVTSFGDAARRRDPSAEKVVPPGRRNPPRPGAASGAARCRAAARRRRRRERRARPRDGERTAGRGGEERRK